MPRTKNRNLDTDKSIGERVRLRRTMLGLSQTELGNKVGLSFQQIQKYERGTNRITAAFLLELAEILDVPITFFLDGCGKNLSKDMPDNRSFLTVARYLSVTNSDVKDAVVALMAAMAGENQRIAVRTARAVAEQRAEPEGPPEPAPPASTQAPDAKPRQRRRRRGAVWDPRDVKGLTA